MSPAARDCRACRVDGAVKQMELSDVIEDVLRDALREALQRCAARGVPVRPDVEEIRVEVPPRRELGDFSSNVALAHAKAADIPARELAQRIAEALELPEGLVERVEVAGPGFLNFHLGRRWLHDELRRILADGEAYGTCNVGEGRRVNIEFVSANPVGPLHIGNARGAPLGDVIANLLSAIGYEVHREYYVNDGPDNTQVNLFGASLRARYLEAIGRPSEMPEDGYYGDYVRRYAGLLVQRHADSLADDQLPDLEWARLVLDDVLEDIRRDCSDFGVEFDTWFRESTLFERGDIDRVLERLGELGETYERDGAIWLRTSAHGDDEDRVVVRSHGAGPSYLGSDVAYHCDKYERGFDHLIDIWGPDHHGRIIATRAGVEALGYADRGFEIIMHQTVRLLRGGKPVRMSKRRGEIVSLREILDAVGRDVARFFFLMRSTESHLDFDLDLAMEQSNENPVYYVQYAHTRMCGIFRQAAEQGVRPEPEKADLSLLVDDREVELMRHLVEFPGEVLSAAQARAAHRLTHYARELARRFTLFYEACKVLGDDPALTQARLALVRGAQVVLGNTLRILGVSAPERM